jgi:DNA replication protein DnaC
MTLEQIKNIRSFENIPSLYRNKLSQGIHKTSVIESGLEFIKSDKQFWLVLGGTGCGKSLGAIYIACLMQNMGITNSYGVHVPDLPKFFFTTCDNVIREEMLSKTAKPRYYNDWLLILDELNAEHFTKTDWWHSKLDSLINHRYEQMKKTIIIGNLTFDKFVEKYPERMTSRLKGLSILVESKDTDMRG